MDKNIKTLDKLPRNILIIIAREFGHRQPKELNNWELADFISRSLPEERKLCK